MKGYAWFASYLCVYRKCSAPDTFSAPNPREKRPRWKCECGDISPPSDSHISLTLGIPDPVLFSHFNISLRLTFAYKAGKFIAERIGHLGTNLRGAMKVALIFGVIPSPIIAVAFTRCLYRSYGTASLSRRRIIGRRR